MYLMGGTDVDDGHGLPGSRRGILPVVFTRGLQWVWYVRVHKLLISTCWFVCGRVMKAALQTLSFAEGQGMLDVCHIPSNFAD